MRTRTFLAVISLVFSSLIEAGCESNPQANAGIEGGHIKSEDPAMRGGGGKCGCERGRLESTVEDYLHAVKKGDIGKMPLARDATYTENWVSTPLGQGVWQQPLPIAFHRSIFDVDTCQSFTEVIVTGGGHPYVIGTRLKVDDHRISEIESIVTDDGDWRFDANGYLTHDSAEDWGVLPARHRPTRDQLLAAANAYYNVFMDNSVVVPWGDPCARLEGGQVYTDPTCNTDVPSGVPWTERHFVVDVDKGAIDGLALMFGTGGLPDSHLFRLTNGTIRYVHTLTICPIYNCGL